MLRSLVTLTHGWDPKVVIYSLQIVSLLIKVGDNIYSQDKHYKINNVSFRVILKSYDMKFMVVIIH